MMNKPVEGVPPLDTTIPDDEYVLEKIVIDIRKKSVETNIRISKQVLAFVGKLQVVPVPPLSFRSPYHTSRLVMVNGRIVSLLEALATAKFGLWNPSKQRPYWTDADWTHEAVSNITMPAAGQPRIVQRPPTSTYGVKAGTPEYFRKYREANKEKNRKYQRDYYKRTRATVEEVRKHMKDIADASSSGTTLDDILAEVEKK